MERSKKNGEKKKIEKKKRRGTKRYRTETSILRDGHILRDGL